MVGMRTREERGGGDEAGSVGGGEEREGEGGRGIGGGK